MAAIPKLAGEPTPPSVASGTISDPRLLLGIMKARLAKKPELADLLIPDWHVGCRRREPSRLSLANASPLTVLLSLAVTPGVGYLEALCEDNVSVVTSSIQRVVAEGIITAEGVLHPLGEF
jgi:hypothetical protein